MFCLGVFMECYLRNFPEGFHYCFSRFGRDVFILSGNVHHEGVADGFGFG